MNCSGDWGDGPDPELIADATGRVRDRGLTPERAVWEGDRGHGGAIRTAGTRQALRVSDLYDVGIALSPR